MRHCSAPSRAGTAVTMTVAAVLAVAGSSGATTLDPFCALQGRRTVAVGNGSSVHGDVAATEPGGRVQLGRKATMSDGTLVAGDEVRLGPGASVFDVEAGDLFLSRGAAVRGARTSADLPILDPPCAIPPLECGGEAVTIPKGRRSASLAPGSYGAVTVRNGATLSLESGVYRLCALDVGRAATVLLPAGPVEIGVAGDVRFGVGSALLPVGGSAPAIVEVAGSSVRFSSRASVSARLSAPNAHLMAGPGAVLAGRFCADRIHASRRTELLCPEGSGTTTTSTVTTSSTSTSSSSSSTTSSSSTASTAPPTTSSTTTTTTLMPFCGDGDLDAGEECDDGNPNPTDGCTSDCTICGNGVVTAPEECDDGNTEGEDGCAPNCTFEGCGNGLIEGFLGETCDDGNTEDGDSCPSTCIIEQCQPIVGSDRTVAVTFDSGGGGNVAGLTLFVDYPEGKVIIPGSGGSVPAGIITDLPGFSLGQTNDLDYAVRQVITDSFAFPDGLAFNIHFENCQGADPPESGEFTCLVEGAADAGGNAVAGVTCAVMAPGSTTTTTIATTSTTAPSTTVSTTSSTSSSTSSTTSSSSTSSTSPTTSSTATSTSSSSSSSTTSTSSSSTSSSSVPLTTVTTTSTSTSTTTLATCGDGVVQPPEDCDDGQSAVPALQGDPNDNDTCPGDCAIEECTLLADTTFTATVAFDAASPIGGGTLLVVYPEGKVGFPVSGPVPPTYFFPLLPSQEVLVRGTDLDHALRVAIADGDPTEPVPVGPVAELRFQTCASQPLPLPGEFQCHVIEMSDPVGNPVQTDVSCRLQFE